MRPDTISDTEAVRLDADSGPWTSSAGSTDAPAVLSDHGVPNERPLCCGPPAISSPGVSIGADTVLLTMALSRG